VALFSNGPADGNPTVVAAAVTGHVTFTGGSLGATGEISATIAGDFGQIAWVTTGGGPSNIVAGNYTLVVVGPPDVYCDGALVGMEPSFATILPTSVGLTGGAVAVTTPSTSEVDVDAPWIATGFLTSPFELDALDSPPTLFAGFTTESGTGPVGTTFVGKYFALDGASASTTFINGSVGAGYVSSSGMDSCTVAWGATLTKI
jgi:hypothetical protein